MPGKTMILVVENDPNDATLLAVAIQRADLSAKVHFVQDAREAMSYLRADGPYAERAEFPLPALLLVDLGLGGMSGLELLKWVRSQATLSGVRVGVLSGSGDDQDRQKALSLGADFYCTKPGSFGELVAIAGRLIRESRVGSIPGHALAPGLRHAAERHPWNSAGEAGKG